jgi:hypothetical protein
MNAAECHTFHLAGLSACWSLIFCKFLVDVPHSLHPSGFGAGDMKKMKKKEEAEVVDEEENIPRRMERMGK